MSYNRYLSMAIAMLIGSAGINSASATSWTCNGIPEPCIKNGTMKRMPPYSNEQRDEGKVFPVGQ